MHRNRPIYSEIYGRRSLKAGKVRDPFSSDREKGFGKEHCTPSVALWLFFCAVQHSHSHTLSFPIANPMVLNINTSNSFTTMMASAYKHVLDNVKQQCFFLGWLLLTIKGARVLLGRIE